jgi:hypothetical protein
MERFHLDLTSILIPIDSSGTRRVETNARNGEICYDFYHKADSPDFKKTSFENS